MLRRSSPVTDLEYGASKESPRLNEIMSGTLVWEGYRPWERRPKGACWLSRSGKHVVRRQTQRRAPGQKPSPAGPRSRSPGLQNWEKSHSVVRPCTPPCSATVAQTDYDGAIKLPTTSAPLNDTHLSFSTSLARKPGAFPPGLIRLKSGPGCPC